MITHLTIHGIHILGLVTVVVSSYYLWLVLVILRRVVSVAWLMFKLHKCSSSWSRNIPFVGNLCEQPINKWSEASDIISGQQNTGIIVTHPTIRVTTCITLRYVFYCVPAQKQLHLFPIRTWHNELTSFKLKPPNFTIIFFPVVAIIFFIPLSGSFWLFSLLSKLLSACRHWRSGPSARQGRRPESTSSVQQVIYLDEYC